MIMRFLVFLRFLLNVGKMRKWFEKEYVPFYEEWQKEQKAKDVQKKHSKQKKDDGTGPGNPPPPPPCPPIC